MKMRKTYILTFAAVAAGIFLAGCSSLKNKNSESDKEVYLPSDREALHKSVEQKTYNSAEIARGIVKGDWTIESVLGQQAVGEKTPYLRFDPETKRVYGNDGCNTINAIYTINPSDSTLTFSSMAATMMMCGVDGITDRQIAQAMADTRRYTWSLEGHDYHLTLLDGGGEQLMSMVHCNFEFLTGAWHVVSINGDPIDVKGMNLVIDVDEGKIHGNTGCNIMNGKVETDLDTPNSISFSAIATTRMACPDLESETRLIVALEDACKAKALSPERVVLLGSDGSPVVEIVRVDPSQVD